MVSLLLHREEVRSVFGLLGETENDMTSALGWCLCQAPVFLRAFSKLLGHPQLAKNPTLRLQRYEHNSGITDLEIYSPGMAFAIIEAKKGFAVPDISQMKKYLRRAEGHEDRRAKKVLATLTQFPPEFVRAQLPSQLERGGVTLTAISWKDVVRAAADSQRASSHAAKRMLREFVDYMGGVSDMQNQSSNETYVLSLSDDTFGGGEIAFVDVVANHHKYFHPVGPKGGWPVEPPNYIAFRYGGELRSIHHVERYKIIRDFKSHFPGLPSKKMEPHFLYDLGPPIPLPKRIPTGASWRANRVWCYLDTLLTCKTVYEAWTVSNSRDE